MRKLLVAAIAAFVVLAISGIACAVNVYTVAGSTKPAGGGTAKKPKPVSLNFDFSVSDEIPANRGTHIEKYFIAAEGLVTYPEAFPKCEGGTDGANNEDLQQVKKTCKKARVGGGIIKAYAGAPSNQTDKLNCVLELNLYNLKPGSYNTTAVWSRSARSTAAWPFASTASRFPSIRCRVSTTSTRASARSHRTRPSWPSTLR